MAICEECGLDMQEAASCVVNVVEIGGQLVPKIPYGQETRANFAEHSPTCHDCGVQVGGYHHPRCDVEECPVCQRQAISCDCPL